MLDINVEGEYRRSKNRWLLVIENDMNKADVIMKNIDN